MANRFVLNETSYHGKGAIKEIASEIQARNFKKAFVCSDPDLLKFGVTKKVTDVLDAVIHSLKLYIEDFEMQSDNTQTIDEAAIAAQIDTLNKEFCKIDIIVWNKYDFTDELRHL